MNGVPLYRGRLADDVLSLHYWAYPISCLCANAMKKRRKTEHAIRRARKYRLTRKTVPWEMGRFAVYKRGKYFHAQIKNPDTGKYLTARSTGQTDYNEAILVVGEWLRDGFPEKTIRQAFDSDTCIQLLRTTKFPVVSLYYIRAIFKHCSDSSD